MCGREDYLRKVRVEGVEMNLCKVCSKYGEPIKKPSAKRTVSSTQNSVRSKRPTRRLKDFERQDEQLKENYGLLIKKKREKEKMKQEDLAKMLSEKESLVHKIESSSIPISIKFAKKIQKILGVKIIEESHGENKVVSSKNDKEGMTLGDMIKDKL